MKKPQGPPPSAGRHLSDDDHAVWQGTAVTLEPLKRAKSRVHASAPRSQEARENAEARRARAERPPSEPVKELHEAPQSPSKKAPPPLAEFDKKKVRKLGRGQHEVEARLDLHGMRQSEAHAALRRFVGSSFQRGLRLVLVITGKGAPGRRDRDDAGFEAGEPGVLRRNVPVWLAEPELRHMVVSYTPAAIRHGGQGALYVHLRSKDKLR